MIRLFVMLCLLISATAWASEEPVNEIYETYLPAEKLIPVLEPMLDPEDRITAFRNKLMVKAPRSRQDKLLELLEDIDRPMRNILIQVRYGSGDTRESSQHAIDLHYEDANQGVRIDNGATDQDHIVVYKGSSRDDKIQVRAIARDHFSTENDNSLSQIRVLEGSQGFLQVGEEIPINHFVLLHPNGYGAPTKYRIVGNGIYVIPRIVKDKVQIELFTSHQRPKSGNSVATTEAQSVLLVEPDVWTPFAGTSTDTSTQKSGKTISTRNLDNQYRSLELKVTILD